MYNTYTPIINGLITSIHHAKSIDTLFKTAVANNSSYFFGSNWGRFIRCGWLGTPLWSKRSGILNTSSMIRSTKCLRFVCDWSIESVSFSPVGRPKYKKGILFRNFIKLKTGKMIGF